MPLGKVDSSRPNDVFGQVLGTEKCSFMRKYGFSSNEGTSEGNELSSKSSSYLIIHEQRNELEKMNEKFEEQKCINKDQENRLKELSTVVTKLTNSLPLALNIKQRYDTSSLYHVNINFILLFLFNIMVFMLVGTHVCLKGFEDPTKTVDTGCLVNSNPTKLVGSHELGPNFAKITTYIIVIDIYNCHLN
ncbi:hypothetical protein M9H77_09329 [Catharanthus roseus]|uniref:Uncharacterized protein n=1 Tax=Catharanthus roseus TaxID=4058 RepID=A0ACC0C0A6_CATRO|nr:hypothetical protein M9H77_09329 [Catharanthus roseus]